MSKEEQMTTIPLNVFKQTVDSVQRYERLKTYLLRKVVWASTHRKCAVGAHENSFELTIGDGDSKWYLMPCPTERMFKQWYDTIVESKMMTVKELEEYLLEYK